MTKTYSRHYSQLTPNSLQTYSKLTPNLLKTYSKLSPDFLQLGWAWQNAIHRWKLKIFLFVTLYCLLHYLFEVLIKESIQHRVGDSSGHGHHVAHCEDGQHQLLLWWGDWLLEQGRLEEKGTDDYLEGLGYIKHQVVDVDWGPGEEEHQADQDQHQVGLLSSCKFPLTPRCCYGGCGELGEECRADPVVDDTHSQARYEVLEKEADDCVDKVERIIRPVLIYLVKIWCTDIKLWHLIAVTSHTLCQEVLPHLQLSHQVQGGGQEDREEQAGRSTWRPGIRLVRYRHVCNTTLHVCRDLSAGRAQDEKVPVHSYQQDGQRWEENTSRLETTNQLADNLLRLLSESDTGILMTDH